MSEIMRQKKPDRQKIMALREKTFEFFEIHGIKWVLAKGKAPFIDGWQTTKVHNREQENWKKTVLESLEFNFGAICGKSSDGLIVVDVDLPEVYEKVFKQFENRTTIVKTGSGNYHVYFRSNDPRVVRGTEIEVGNKVHHIKGEGGQVIAPGSLHPDNDKPYTFVNMQEPMLWKGDIRYELKKMIADAFDIDLRKGTEIDIEALLEGVSHGERDESAIILATWFRVQGKTRNETKKLLLEWNQRCDPSWGEHPEDQESAEEWINRKIESAWRPQDPYKYNFAEKEIFDEETRAAANKLLESSDLLWQIHEANPPPEIVWEDKNKVLIPVLELGKLSFEVTGASASGKNNLVKKALLCCPKHWIDEVSGLTDRSVRWMEDVRTLVINERRGMGRPGDESTAEYDIKVGISEGKIILRYAEKVGNKIVGAKRVVEIGNIITTSTEFAPPPELENRLINICSNESAALDMAVRDAILDSWELLPGEALNTEERQKVLRCAFAIADKDAPTKVVNPFGRKLKAVLPILGKPSIRRNAKKLRDITNAVARLYYRQLPVIERNQKKVILITPELFWLTWRIADEAITSAVAELTPRQLSVWRKINEYSIEFSEFSTTQIAENYGEPRQTWLHRLKTFGTKGLLSGRREGSEWIWRKVEKTLKKRSDEIQSISLAELRKTFDNWCKKHRVKPTAISQTLKGKIIDPLTGSPISAEKSGRDKIQIKSGFLANGRKKSTRKSTPKPDRKNNSSTPEMEDFKTVIES